MDSFYGAPRQPPTLPTVNSVKRIPAVPEVSILAPKNSDYNLAMRPQNMHNHKDSLNCNLPKHVRFKTSSSGQGFGFGKENMMPETLKAVPDLNGKTFKQIYMANVPDRHLDLSIFEPPRNESKPADFVQAKRDLSVTKCSTHFSQSSIEKTNYTPRYADFLSAQKTNRVCSNQKPPPKCLEMCTQTENNQVTTINDDPSIKDLYRIIQQQNEQIMLLQRQVNNLKTSIRQPEIDSVPFETPGENPFVKELTNSPNKGLFSFDVKATSFEFSFRPQQHKFRRQEFLEPKIQEIVECANTENPTNSLHLDESLNVGNSYVSNVPSIEIKMDEYHSSDEDEEPQATIGLTFYKDLMDQVNNVLRKVQKQSKCLPPKVRQEIAGQTMKVVEETTLQHLKKIGVNLPPIQESSEVTKDSELDQDDISCAVQQLLMKYLPEDKLTKAINKPKEPPPRIKPAGSELSFATLQYMKKYNLIDNSKFLNDKKKVRDINPKILDVTALKLQPKLL